jgi:NAD-dependent dihydropyrimidine dehydrogenase PreA subunit
MDGEWLPIIHPDLCIGCGACITACPVNALGQCGGKAVLAYPRLCTYCAECETICPYGAIELPYLICTSTTSRKEKSYE